MQDETTSVPFKNVRSTGFSSCCRLLPFVAVLRKPFLVLQERLLHLGGDRHHLPVALDQVLGLARHLVFQPAAEPPTTPG